MFLRFFWKTEKKESCQGNLFRFFFRLVSLSVLEKEQWSDAQLFERLAFFRHYGGLIEGTPATARTITALSWWAVKGRPLIAIPLCRETLVSRKAEVKKKKRKKKHLKKKDKKVQFDTENRVQFWRGHLVHREILNNSLCCNLFYDNKHLYS